MSQSVAGIASPCVNICQIDSVSGLCRGCLRTLDEIACWLEYSAAEKRAVLEKLETRQRMGAPA